MSRVVSLLFLTISPLLLFTACEQSSTDQEATIDPNYEEKVKELRKRILSYTEAINQQDIDKLISHWSDKAVYKNPFTGELSNGREGIKKEYRKIFKKIKGGKVDIRVDTIRFPIENKAVEEGIGILTIPGRDPLESDYKMIYVKENGEWLILHVSELGFGYDKN